MLSKRIGFDVNDDFFWKIKEHTLKKKKSIKDYLIELIKQDLQKEQEGK